MVFPCLQQKFPCSICRECLQKNLDMQGVNRLPNLTPDRRPILTCAFRKRHPPDSVMIAARLGVHCASTLKLVSLRPSAASWSRRGVGAPRVMPAAIRYEIAIGKIVHEHQDHVVLPLADRPPGCLGNPQMGTGRPGGRLVLFVLPLWVCGSRRRPTCEVTFEARRDRAGTYRRNPGSSAECCVARGSG